MEDLDPTALMTGLAAPRPPAYLRQRPMAYARRGLTKRLDPHLVGFPDEETPPRRGFRRRLLGLFPLLDQPACFLLSAIQTRSVYLARVALRNGTCRDLVRLLMTGATVNRSNKMVHISHNGSTLHVRGEAQLSYASARRFFVPLAKSGWTAIDEPHTDEVLMRGPNSLRFTLDKSKLESGMCALYRRFVAKEYEMLDVQGCQILEIGVEFGDTAVAFLRRGAVTVYGFEPFRRSFDRTLRNIALCGHGGKVHLFQSAVSVGLYVPSGLEDEEGPEGFPFPFMTGKEISGYRDENGVSFMTLADAVAKCRPDLPIVCKMEVEAASSDIFQSEDVQECIAQFDRMVVEHHSSDADLVVQPLHDAGFSTHIVRHAPDLNLILAMR